LALVALPRERAVIAQWYRRIADGLNDIALIVDAEGNSRVFVVEVVGQGSIERARIEVILDRKLAAEGQARKSRQGQCPLSTERCPRITVVRIHRQIARRRGVEAARCRETLCRWRGKGLRRVRGERTVGAAARERVEGEIETDIAAVAVIPAGIHDGLDCLNTTVLMVVGERGLELPVLDEALYESRVCSLLTARCGGTEQCAACCDQAPPELCRLRLQLHPQPPPPKARPPEDASLLK